MVKVEKCEQRVAGSFRDPAGFLFWCKNVLYRQINHSYQNAFDQLIESGLYQQLVDEYLLISHEESDDSLAVTESAYKIIRPKLVSFISYPYEWCFGQLKDAALTTLTIQKHALEHGMVLKDASSYNIQFVQGRPVLIDTLSFSTYNEGEPWIAYRQFCQHFLAPLAIMSHCDIRLNQLLRIYLDGIPLDLARQLLPWKTRFNLPLATHIHLHAKSQQRYADSGTRKIKGSMSKNALLGLIDNLESGIRKLSWEPGGTTWADYYDDTNYDSGSFASKKTLVGNFLDKVKPQKVWDLGANTGVFSRIAAGKKISTISFDFDPAAVEKNYRECVTSNDQYQLPLILDLTNPSPAIGWEHAERMSLHQRGPVDCVLALALIHHLAIGNNVPLDRIGCFFHSICRNLIIEFIPKEDSQVQRLLASREDVFPNYKFTCFEQEFGRYFTLEKSVPVAGSERTLHLMRART